MYKTNCKQRDSDSDTLWNCVQEIPMPRRNSPFMTLVLHSVEMKNFKLRPKPSSPKLRVNKNSQSNTADRSDCSPNHTLL